MLNLDHLKEGIGLRGWGQKNPLIEYKKEAFAMFKEMITHIHFDVIRHIFHLNLEKFNARELEQRREKELNQINLVSGQSDQTSDTSAQQRTEPKIGRNDLCPCNSGKKYKKCCQ